MKTMLTDVSYSSDRFWFVANVLTVKSDP